MFVYDFLQLPQPMDEVYASLVRHGSAWVPAASVAAGNAAVELAREVGIEPETVRALSTLAATMGEPRFANRAAMIPIHWSTAWDPPASPLDTDLRIEPIAKTITHVGIDGTVRPQALPAVSQAELRHLANAALRVFLGELTRRVSSERGGP